MCPVHLENVRMIWKVSWRSKKCPDNLQNVSGWYGKCLDDQKSVWIIWKVSGPDNLKSVRIIWKVSWRSKKCLINLENVSEWSKKCLNNLKNVSRWYGKCPGDLKNVWIIWKVSCRFYWECNKFCIYSIKGINKLLKYK